jgi:hypothetical protein
MRAGDRPGGRPTSDNGGIDGAIDDFIKAMAAHNIPPSVVDQTHTWHCYYTLIGCPSETLKSMACAPPIVYFTLDGCARSETRKRVHFN